MKNSVLEDGDGPGPTLYEKVVETRAGTVGEAARPVPPHGPTSSGNFSPVILE